MRESNFPGFSTHWAAPVLQEHALLCPLPCLPNLGGDLWMLYLSWSLVAASLPSPEHHLTSVRELKKSCCLCWIAIQTFCPKWAVCFKIGGSNGKRKRRLFKRYVWLVAFNGGVKLYKCEMLLLLFMNYPAPCLTLPEISFYWHMQSSAILWLLSLLQAYPQPQWGVQGPDASTGIWLTKMCKWRTSGLSWTWWACRAAFLERGF